MGRDARCRETETFLSESCCSYLKCVLLLALEPVTQAVPGDPLKGEYREGCSQSGIEDESASHKEDSLQGVIVLGLARETFMILNSFLFV